MKVAVALIYDEHDRVLITKRPLDASHGGFWEFPGGKLEANESAQEALVREIKEEVGLNILSYNYCGEINHNYSDKSVQLIVFKVTEFEGIAQCLEGQLDLAWLEPDQLDADAFPEANHSIFRWL